MYRRLLAALAASAMLVAAVVPATALADSPTRHIQRAELAKIDPSFRPYLADAEAPGHRGAPAHRRPRPSVVAGLTKTQQRARAAELRTGQGRSTRGITSRRRPRRGPLPVRLQRHQGPGQRLASLAGARRPPGCRRHPAAAHLHASTNANAVPYIGAPAAWQDARRHRRRPDDRGHRHRHRLHARRLRRPGHARRPIAANNPDRDRERDVPDGQGHRRLRLRRQRLRRGRQGRVVHARPGPGSARLLAATGATSPAPPPATASRRTTRTYTGPYNGTTLADPTHFVVGPGVAPEAKLVALKVFGCDGTTNLVVDALEWVASYNASHADGIDVVNLSLGSPFGTNTDPDAVAINNLVDTGVVVVASAGNENAVPYITGAPAAATKAISVAALDAFPDLPDGDDRPRRRHRHHRQSTRTRTRRCPSAATLHVLCRRRATGSQPGLRRGRLRRRAPPARSSSSSVASARSSTRALRRRLPARRHHRDQPDDTAPATCRPSIGYNPERSRSR